MPLRPPAPPIFKKLEDAAAFMTDVQDPLSTIPPLLFCLEVLATSIAFYFLSLTLSFAPKKELEFGRWEETKKPNNPNTTPLGLGELLLEFQCDASPTLHYSKILWIFEMARFRKSIRRVCCGIGGTLYPKPSVVMKRQSPKTIKTATPNLFLFCMGHECPKRESKIPW